MSSFSKPKASRWPELMSESMTPMRRILIAWAHCEVGNDEIAVVSPLDGSASTPAREAALRAFRQLLPEKAFEAVCATVATEHVLPFVKSLIDLATADGTLAGAEKGLRKPVCGRLCPIESFLEAAVEAIGTKNVLSTL
jgi:hypothetical protein